MKNAQFYIYFEDEALVVGIRSEQPFEGSDYDGEFHFTYLQGDNHHFVSFEPFGLEASPEMDGVHITIEGELKGILKYDETHSIQFNLFYCNISATSCDGVESCSKQCIECYNYATDGINR